MFLFFGQAPFQSRSTTDRLALLLNTIGSDKSTHSNLDELYWDIAEAQKQDTGESRAHPSQRVFCLGPSRKSKYAFELTSRSLLPLVNAIEGTGQTAAGVDADPEPKHDFNEAALLAAQGLPSSVDAQGEEAEEGAEVDIDANAAADGGAHENDDDLATSNIAKDDLTSDCSSHEKEAEMIGSDAGIV